MGDERAVGCDVRQSYADDLPDSEPVRHTEEPFGEYHGGRYDVGHHAVARSAGRHRGNGGRCAKHVRQAEDDSTDWIVPGVRAVGFSESGEMAVQTVSRPRFRVYAGDAAAGVVGIIGKHSRFGRHFGCVLVRCITEQAAAQPLALDAAYHVCG